jgi:hypothetical protein
MRQIRSMKTWLVPTAGLLMAVGACGRSDSSRADDALKNDLALAAQTQAYQPQQFMSPMEQGANPYAAQYPTPYGYPQQIQAVQRAPSYPARTTTARRTSTGTATRSSGTYPAPAPAPEPQRNTKRDAVIGAAAGAVLGASTSRDKVKGAIIGAAAGGILGGIIGHTVDVKR